MSKYEYEIRQIDATAYDDGWDWNDSSHVCYFESAAENMSRAFMRKLHALGISFNVPVKVVFDWSGDVWEVQIRKSGEPLFACIPSYY